MDLIISAIAIIVMLGIVMVPAPERARNRK